MTKTTKPLIEGVDESQSKPTFVPASKHNVNSDHTSARKLISAEAKLASAELKSQRKIDALNPLTLFGQKDFSGAPDYKSHWQNADEPTRLKIMWDLVSEKACSEDQFRKLTRLSKSDFNPYREVFQSFRTATLLKFQGNRISIAYDSEANNSLALTPTILALLSDAPVAEEVKEEEKNEGPTWNFKTVQAVRDESGKTLGIPLGMTREEAIEAGLVIEGQAKESDGE